MVVWQKVQVDHISGVRLLERRIFIILRPIFYNLSPHPLPNFYPCSIYMSFSCSSPSRSISLLRPFAFFSSLLRFLKGLVNIFVAL